MSDLHRPERRRSSHPRRHVVFGPEGCGGRPLLPVPQVGLEREPREVRRLPVGGPRRHVEPQLEVIMVAGGVVPQQQGAVHVELDSEVEGQGRTAVRVQAMAVRAAPGLRGVLGQLAVGFGEEVLAIWNCGDI